MYKNLQCLTLLSVTLLLFVAGCNSHHPLSDPRHGSVDERLLGHWKCTHEGETVFLHVDKKTVSEDMVWMQIAAILFDGKKEMQVKRWVGFPTTLGDHHFFNGAVTENFEHLGSNRDTDELLSTIKIYSLLKYDVTTEHLDLYVPDSDFIRSATESGTIKGNGPMLTDSCEKLGAFFLTQDKKLFTDATRLRFTRVK